MYRYSWFKLRCWMGPHWSVPEPFLRNQRPGVIRSGQNSKSQHASLIAQHAFWLCLSLLWLKLHSLNAYAFICCVFSGGELSLNVILNLITFSNSAGSDCLCHSFPSLVNYGWHMLPFKKLLTNYNLSNNWTVIALAFNMCGETISPLVFRY